MKQITIRTWAHIALFNLLLVACLGLLMRLKILLPLSWVDQRFTLHAHSHFAFSGWISHAILLSISTALFRLKFDQILPSRYNRLLIFNLFCAYGMLVSFFLQGYAAASIAFSTLSILVSFIIYRFCTKDVHESDRNKVWWKYIHAALIFNILSCLGTFSLAWTMVTQPGNTELRLSSVYFYLHFQYNGWFFFACMGLFQHWLQARNITLPGTMNQYRIFSFTCAPMYLLSINWMAFPVSLHIITILTALIQFSAFVYFAYALWQSKSGIMKGVSITSRYLLTAVFIAVSIKFVLQTASSIPAMAQLAFGLRPVVIAYLHLVLLGIISLFLIFWFYTHDVLKSTSATRFSIGAFVFGVILNEFFLMIQGLGAISGIYVGYMPEALAVAGLVMVSGVGMLVWDNLKSKKGQIEITS
jgi:hypothetical protein